MRSSDSDIIFVPGLGGAGPDHWQSRWAARLSTARRVEQEVWDEPHPEAWAGKLVEAVAASTRPALIVAHGLGVLTTIVAAPAFRRDVVRGAFLVAPPDVERPDMRVHRHAFSPVSREPLPFPSLLVASRTDPLCSYERAEDFAYSWGSALVDAGESGHLNDESGHGPWPEGLMRLAGFMKDL
ncbi:RBBP9/YdeN family alpha/beta hydrolase [Enterovirga rhinocerotis]|nr:alpha/beta hydrolase [Enterovirga rhinocerotis]